MDIITNILLFIFTVLIVFVAYVKHCYSYWKRRNVTYLEPKFPLGNNTSILPKGISVGTISEKFYNKFKSMGLQYGGVYNCLSPQLVIVDPDYAKLIMKTDFAYFGDRGIYLSRAHPITVNIFAQTGAEWKNARTKLTPSFTVSKLKSMFAIVKGCSEQLDQYLETYVQVDKDILMLDILALFTTDVIGSIIFGLECNSFKNPDGEFRTMGRKVFDEFTLLDKLRLAMTMLIPKIANAFNISNIPSDVDTLFTKCIKDTVEYREKNNITRVDIIQVLIEMKKKGQMSLDEIVGQTFLLFLAGFETSSNAGSMALFEMGLNQEAQNRARAEINEVWEKYDNEFTYDSLGNMKYLNQIFEETLRKWPPVSTLTRVCERDFNLPGTDLIIEKGTLVLIPVLALHRDADYFPDPMKWDPDRFGDDANKDVPYYPFGEGPRTCLGTRFGYMQVKLALATILRKYEITVSPNTMLPLELDPDTFVLHTKNPIYLRLKKI